MHIILVYFLLKFKWFKSISTIKNIFFLKKRITNIYLLFGETAISFSFASFTSKTRKDGLVLLKVNINIAWYMNFSIANNILQMSSASSGKSADFVRLIRHTYLAGEWHRTIMNLVSIKILEIKSVIANTKSHISSNINDEEYKLIKPKPAPIEVDLEQHKAILSNFTGGRSKRKRRSGHSTKE